MKIAIPVTGEVIGGPGEAREILLLDSDKDFAIAEKYENPALTATSARGISMIQSVLDRKAGALIVGHIGQHAFSYANGKLKIYSGLELTISEVIEGFRNGTLIELTGELQGNHSHHH